MGVDVLGWVQTVNPPDFDLPRKENPRRKHSDVNNEVPYSVSTVQFKYFKFFSKFKRDLLDEFYFKWLKISVIVI